MPSITPLTKTGIGKYSHQAIVDTLRIDILPAGDFTGGGIDEVTVNIAKPRDGVQNGNAYYFRFIPAVQNKVTEK